MPRGDFDGFYGGHHGDQCNICLFDLQSSLMSPYYYYNFRNSSPDAPKKILPCFPLDTRVGLA